MSAPQHGDDRGVALIKPRQALALVEARLGRPPRDGLEAAVVLEAWGGLRPNVALELGERVMEVVPDTDAEPPRPPRRRAPKPIGWLAELLGLVGFVSMATWGVPIGKALPNVDVDLAFRVGVPFALALQWMVRRRYFSGEGKLGSFGSDGAGPLVVFLLLLCAIAATGPTGILVAVLEVIWFSGYLVAKDGTGIIYVIGLGATTWALYAEVPPERVLPVVAATLAAVAVLRVVRHNRIRNLKTERNAPVAWREVFPSMIIGASLGLMMVFSVTHLRPNGWMLAAALVPAGAGALVAAAIMRTLWFRLDTELAIAPGRTANNAGSRAVSRRLVFAAASYFTTCLALSCFVASVLVDSGQQPLPTLQLLGGLALFYSLAMMADFQHAWNRIGWAFLIAVPACGTELGMRFVLADASAAFAIGASVGLLVSVWALMAFMRRPARVLATSVSIP